MPSEKNTSKFNQCTKLQKMPYIIYADFECIVKRTEGYENNPETSSTWKAYPCRYLMSTTWGFKHIKNKHTLYHGKDYMKMFCESLKEHATKIIGFKKKKMLPLTNKVKSTQRC